MTIEIDERLDLEQVKGFSPLHPDLKEGMKRLEFTEDHEDLVQKLCIVGELTTHHLNRAEGEERILSFEETEEIYRLQNVLFTNDDLQRLAEPLFGSPNLDEDGKVDKNSWFWKLVDPTGGVPHLGQANEMTAETILKHVETLPETQKKNIFEGGMGGGKTAVAIAHKLRPRLIQNVAYNGVERAPALVEHLREMFNGGMPDYFKDMGRINGFVSQVSDVGPLRGRKITNGEMTEEVSNLEDGSQDVMVFSYVIHHLKCGEAFIQALENGNLQHREDGFFFVTEGKEVKLDFQLVKANILEFVGGDEALMNEVLHVINTPGRFNWTRLRDIIENNQKDLLEECRGKLKPGGKVIISDPNKGLSNFNRSVIIKDAEGLADFTSPELMNSMLSEAGYKEIKVFAQWGMPADVYNRHKRYLGGHNTTTINGPDGVPISYVVALPLNYAKAMGDLNGIDKNLGYYVEATNPGDPLIEAQDSTADAITAVS